MTPPTSSVPDFFLSDRKGYHFLWPNPEGRAQSLYQEININGKMRPQGWLFGPEVTERSETINHHERGVSNGDLFFLDTLLEVMGNKVGLIVENIQRPRFRIPCSDGQTEKYQSIVDDNAPVEVLEKPKITIIYDYPQDDLRQLHPTRLPTDHDEAIKAFLKFV